MSFLKEQEISRINEPRPITPISDEEDFLQMADKLEKNPPSGLSPGYLSLMIQILKSGEPI